VLPLTTQQKHYVYDDAGKCVIEYRVEERVQYGNKAHLAANFLSSVKEGASLDVGYILHKYTYGESNSTNARSGEGNDHIGLLQSSFHLSNDPWYLVCTQRGSKSQLGAPKRVYLNLTCVRWRVGKPLGSRSPCIFSLFSNSQPFLLRYSNLNVF